ncbi:MAG: M4 family metallopeptidase, partial [Deltaproteobacteria bacterium]|nr:M4 family metallopeptidase [Deltaproteobacteria bacterium]
MRTLKLSILISIAAGCQQGAPGGGESKDDRTDLSDVDSALALLPDAEVLETHEDGLPRFVIGELAKAGDMQIDDAGAADAALRGSLSPVLAVFRLNNDDLVLRKMNVDEEGGRHFRYDQVHDGLPVIGGELVVHVDVKGAINAVNGTARGDLPALGSSAVSQATAMTTISQDSRFAGLAVASPRRVYIQTDDGVIHAAYEAIASGMRGADPAHDKVYVDIDSNEVVAVYPTIHFARNRKIHSANNGSSLPGTLKRSEGQAAGTDTAVNASYDNSGATYDAYANFWNRDSYNNAGATLNQTVHYQTNYCNAFWNGSQMVYGDGNASQGCGSLALSLDVTGHEMTHAVTEYESGLVYSGESGGINESFSDMFGAFVEAWVDGGRNGTLANNANVWLIGDEVLAPFLRSMCDPAADGASRDVWSSSLGSVDVHYSSGPANLMFCLLSKGGTHPRGKTTVNVPAIGMAKAIRLAYKAQVDILTSTSKYSNLRTAMEQAATSLGYDQATKDAVGCAFAAISVGSAPANCGGGNPPPPPPGEVVLANGVPVTGVSDATGGKKYWRIDVPAGQTQLTINITGGTGDADLYVQSGSQPTTETYQCRPYKDGNAEGCVFSPPAQGTYYVMLHAYAAYSGLTLTATYSATQGGDPYLTNGTAVTGVSGAQNTAQYWRVATPAGKTLTVKISGGSGDADLYTKFGARPTTTSYLCRPYVNGNTETCTA